MQDRLYIHRIYLIDHTKTCNFNISHLRLSQNHGKHVAFFVQTLFLTE